ncbi:MAG: U32 family peptidase [Mycoplasmataceae bacterium]|nr:U32 family peptidase [Mycoplasmataceae bacterium]
MLLLINPSSYKNAIDLINLNVDSIFIGTKEYSCRNNCNLSIEQIRELTLNKKQAKIYILVNAFFFDQQLEALTNYLCQISKLNIDGIIFSDVAVNQICCEQKINIHLIYTPETLVTNYDQFPFYLDNHISEVSLARELNINEIKEIAKNKDKMKLQIQVGGYAYMMHSRWKLISNFKEVNKLNEGLTNQKLLIREVTRDKPCIIYEDIHGTHILTNYSLCLFDKLKELNDIGIDTIRIDSFLHNDEWTLKVAQLYLDGIEAIKDGTFNEDLAKKTMDELKQLDEISHGFYSMGKDDLFCLLKDET